MLRRRIKSFYFAAKGLKIFFSTQPNALIHLLATVSVTTAGFWFQITKTEWLFIVVAIGLVLMAEAFNTAIEFLVDLVSPQYNETAGKIKDLAAAGVLIAAVTSATIGCWIFIPYLFLSK